ncbi:hypothetical protein [Bradyrhizobium sp. USDA 3650]
MKDPVEHLKMLRRQFKVQYRGHRKEIVALTCRGFTMALKIRKSKKRRELFFLTANIPSKGRDRLDIVTEVLVYAMSGEKSERKRKLAWKRSRAIQYLHRSGVAIKDLGREISSQGGIEALVRKASKEDPRRTRAGQQPQPSRPARSNFPSSADEDEEEADETTPYSNNQPSLIMLKIKLSDLDAIRDIESGKRAKLTIKRLTTKSPIAEVRRVQILD